MSSTGTAPANEKFQKSANIIGNKMQQVLCNKAFWFLVLLFCVVFTVQNAINFYVLSKVTKKEERTKLSGDYENSLLLSYWVTYFSVVLLGIGVLYCGFRIYLRNDH
jgi:hypothetical protein